VFACYGNCGKREHLLWEESKGLNGSRWLIAVEQCGNIYRHWRGLRPCNNPDNVRFIDAQCPDIKNNNIYGFLMLKSFTFAYKFGYCK
jgi:hypothetical protein